eukprot:1858311-Prymnesium_polylepis.1
MQTSRLVADKVVDFRPVPGEAAPPAHFSGMRNGGDPGVATMPCYQRNHPPLICEQGIGLTLWQFSQSDDLSSVALHANNAHAAWAQGHIRANHPVLTGGTDPNTGHALFLVGQPAPNANGRLT